MGFTWALPIGMVTYRNNGHLHGVEPSITSGQVDLSASQEKDLELPVDDRISQEFHPWSGIHGRASLDFGRPFLEAN